MSRAEAAGDQRIIAGKVRRIKENLNFIFSINSEVIV